MPVARQQIPNMNQWTNCEQVFSMRSAQQLHDATVGRCVFYVVRAEVL
jgi:hypothetical protein